ncbi:hypothetical protein OH540_20935 [Streptomyces sp. BPPL-273]|nr:hypothetical protein [Streptomyces sp. BPPL-273]WHM32374.1 hypothetical protein OH540_20935 [Streptomyces sp. BPPL-273]
MTLAAKSGSSFWPTGAIMLVVIAVIVVSIGIWRSRKAKDNG